ncbi:glycoside hydrolase superfamily [Schizophyllum amplum]|uniref:Beta-galactosidase n=1 Tax=Schizophyllum amplum TaxID=97359 RepID=A0A550CDX8_9AGAR|nr:glycoside hydrolase superfamily [Auriculariopsis ampla]
MVVSSLLLLLLLPAVLGLRLPSGRILAPRTDDGYTSQVSWDGYSFSIQTPSQDTPQRVFIQSGEMHTWRLPVPTLWRDIVQKAKAAGLNCISIYFHWALTNPKEGVVDMEGINDIQPLFDYAKEAGLWVIARPGPYINAETSGGGIPGWVTTLPGDPEWNPYNGELRSNDTYFHDAWQQYIRASAQLIAKNQITKGGPIILAQVENEFYNGAGQNEYVSELQGVYRDEGIVVPTMVNDAGMYKNIVNEANIYGIDAYPNGWTCIGDLSWPTAAAGWEKGPAAWRTYHENVMPDTPFMFPEFQGGQYDKWGSGVGYARCREVIGPEYERVLYHQLWASGVTAENFYMFYGGTNWGQLAYPATYTSYDVGAAVTESRELTTKYSELKLQSLFLRSTPDLYKTDFVSNDSSTLTSNERVMATWLKNPDTGASFYITRQANVSWSDVESYKLTTEDFTLPQLGGELTLNGKDSRIIVKDLSVGAASLLYSTAHIMTSTVVDETDVLVIYADVGETVELAFDISEIITVDATLDVKSNISTTTAIVNFQMTTGITPIRLSGDGTSIILVVAADYPTATTFWQPTIAGDDDFAAYVHIGANTPVLVVGPYLVRTATLEDNDSTLVLTGDLNATTTLTVIAPDAIQALTWNGEPVSATRNDWGALTATLPGPELTPQIPDLTSLTWKYTDSLPEIQPGYDDSQWTPANHTETTSKFPQFYGGPWKLGVASDYGYHVGNLLWRGHFDYNGQAAVNLSISGGFNFAAAAWVNDVYLGATEGGASSTRNVSWAFPEGSLTEGDNVITAIVCCSPGGRQRDIQSPRGIEGYYLLGSDSSSVDQFTSWKVQGNFGGEDHPDKTRRIFNEGGLFGERMGYHLPGYDDSDWETKSPWDGIDKPGVAWYRTTFDLELPEGHDIPMSFVFSNDTGFYRAQLYVNGWQMGKRVANLGPQTAFPVHEGILNYRGSNTLALSLWSLGSAPEDLSIPSLMLQPSGTYSGGVGGVEVNNPGWEDRQAW